MEEPAATCATPAAARLVDGADVPVHAAAALPIQASRDAIRSANVDGTGVVFAAALEAGAGRAVQISSTAVYGSRSITRPRGRALVGVGDYGESKIEAERVARRAGRRGLGRRPAPETFIGPERLGVFEILSTGSARPSHPVLGDGSNRTLLAVEDLSRRP